MSGAPLLVGVCPVLVVLRVVFTYVYYYTVTGGVNVHYNRYLFVHCVTEVFSASLFTV